MGESRRAKKGSGVECSDRLGLCVRGLGVERPESMAGARARKGNAAVGNVAVDMRCDNVAVGGETRYARRRSLLVRTKNFV